jgi:hypothetical protein
LTNQLGIYGTKGVPSANIVPGARGSSISWIDSNGKLRLFGGYGFDKKGYLSYLNDLWSINVKTNQTLNNLVSGITKSYGDPTFSLTTTSSSELPVSYTSSNLNVATVTGAEVMIIGAGTATITATQDGDNEYYAATPVTQTLTVDKATLTAVADDKSREYGVDNPSFTITYVGFKNSESTAAIDSPPLATTLATKESLPGSYIISVSGGTDNNYEFNYVEGTLTINMITDVDEIETSNSLYPNPTNHSIFLNLSEVQVNSLKGIKVYTIDGKHIKDVTYNKSNSKVELDVSEIKSGSYLIVLDFIRQRTVFKFIKD